MGKQIMLKDLDGGQLHPFTRSQHVIHEDSNVHDEVENLRYASATASNRLDGLDEKTSSLESENQMLTDRLGAAEREIDDNTEAIAENRAEINRKQFEAEALVIDPVPTPFSENMVRSGGIYTYGEGIREEAQRNVKGLNDKILASAHAVMVNNRLYGAVEHQFVAGNKYRVRAYNSTANDAHVYIRSSKALAQDNIVKSAGTVGANTMIDTLVTMPADASGSWLTIASVSLGEQEGALDVMVDGEDFDTLNGNVKTLQIGLETTNTTLEAVKDKVVDVIGLTQSYTEQEAMPPFKRLDVPLKAGTVVTVTMQTAEYGSRVSVYLKDDLSDSGRTTEFQFTEDGSVSKELLQDCYYIAARTFNVPEVAEDVTKNYTVKVVGSIENEYTKKETTEALSSELSRVALKLEGKETTFSSSEASAYTPYFAIPKVEAGQIVKITCDSSTYGSGYHVYLYESKTSPFMHELVFKSGGTKTVQLKGSPAYIRGRLAGYTDGETVDVTLTFEYDGVIGGIDPKIDEIKSGLPYKYGAGYTKDGKTYSGTSTYKHIVLRPHIGLKVYQGAHNTGLPMITLTDEQMNKLGNLNTGTESTISGDDWELTEDIFFSNIIGTHCYYIIVNLMPDGYVDDSSFYTKMKDNRMLIGSVIPIVRGNRLELFKYSITDEILGSNRLDMSLCLRSGTNQGRYKSNGYYLDCDNDTTQSRYSVQLYDDQFNIHATKDVTIVPVTKKSNPSSMKRVLVIGDSWIYMKVTVQELIRRLTGTGGTPEADGFTNISFVGTVNSSDAPCEGYSGENYEFFLGDDSPFWYNGKVDIDAYVSDHGYSKIDYAIIQLGTNGGIPDLDKPRALYDALLVHNPSMKILVGSGLMKKNPYGWSGTSRLDQGIHGLMTRPKTFIYLNNLEAMIEAEYSENIFYVSIAAQFDGINNWRYEEVAANNRNNDVKVLQGIDNVHPASSGYLQCADAYYNAFHYWCLS